MVVLSDILSHNNQYRTIDGETEEKIRTFVDHRLTGLKYVGAKKSYAVTRYYMNFEDPIMTRYYAGTKRSQTEAIFKALINSSNCTLRQDGSSLILDVANSDEERGTLVLGDGVAALECMEKKPNALECYVGESANGHPVILNIADESTPHTLIAGSSGSGKSTTLHSILVTLLSRYDEKELTVDLIDVKVATANTYKGINQVKNTITDRTGAMVFLSAKLEEMHQRMKYIHDKGNYDSLNEYNNDVDEGERIPYNVIVIDEVDQLLGKTHKDEESVMIRSTVKELSAMARSAGIHFILASQKAVSTNIPTDILSNVSGRIALKSASTVDSRLLIDDDVATKLKGRGDAYIKQNENIIRAQVAYLGLKDRRLAIEAIKNK